MKPCATIKILAKIHLLAGLGLERDFGGLDIYCWFALNVWSVDSKVNNVLKSATRQGAPSLA